MPLVEKFYLYRLVRLVEYDRLMIVYLRVSVGIRVKVPSSKIKQKSYWSKLGNGWFSFNLDDSFFLMSLFNFRLNINVGWQWLGQLWWVRIHWSKGGLYKIVFMWAVRIHLLFNVFRFFLFACAFLYAFIMTQQLLSITQMDTNRVLYIRSCISSVNK